MPSGKLQSGENGAVGGDAAEEGLEQAAVLSLAAPSSYFWSPIWIWMVGSCALSTASADPSGGRAVRRVHQSLLTVVRPAEVDSAVLTGVLASSSKTRGAVVARQP